MGGATSHSGQHNDIVAGLQAVGYSVVDYGAAGDSSTDDYAAIVAAITAATPTKGTVVFPPSLGDYMISAGLDIPDGVSLQSYGGPVTLKASQSMDWMVRVDYTISIVGNRKGRIIGLVLDGNSLADIGWYIGLGVQRYWERCDATGCNDTGWLLNGTQNCVFVACDTEDNGDGAHPNGGGMRLNHGAGNNLFLRGEYNRNADHQLVICDSDAIDAEVAFPAGTFAAGPTSNHWLGCVFERAAATTTSQIYVRAGKDNQWLGCNIAVEASRIGVHCEDLDKTIALLRFFGCGFSGADTSAICYQAEDAYRTFFTACYAETFGYLLKLDDGSPVIIPDDFHTGGVSVYFQNLGTSQQDDLVIGGLGETFIVAGRGIRYGVSASAAVIANGDTVSSVGVGVGRVAPAGDVTGIVITSGFYTGQQFQVVNESAHSVTFAAAGTSRVATGTGCVIAANRAAYFTWDSSTARWYQS